MGKSGPNRNFSSRAQIEALAPKMRVGLFGGSFNPAHAGHVHVAETARKRLALHRVLWLVSPGNPLKQPETWDGYERRLAGARAITSNLPTQFACESEAVFGTRYSNDTVAGIKQRWPEVRFVWLMGADNLANFHLWRNWQQLAKSIPIAVIARSNDSVRARLSPFVQRFAHYRKPAEAAQSLVADQAPAWVYLTAPYCELSSTAIREATDMAGPVTNGRSKS